VYAALVSTSPSPLFTVLLAALVAYALPACVEVNCTCTYPTPPDAQTAVDAGHEDAGVEVDAGPELDAGPDAGPLSAMAIALTARTAACPAIAGAPLYSLDPGGAATVQLCQRAGALWFRADLDVDCNGGLDVSCTSDPSYLPDTAFTTSAGDPIDANTVPYVVIPMPRAGFDYHSFGIARGQSVAVVYAGQVVYGVLGDLGPADVVGAASYALAEALGVSPTPSSGGISAAEVTYVFFTGSANEVVPLESNAEAARVGEAAARAFIAIAP
jgi:hypothetical protein